MGRAGAGTQPLLTAVDGDVSLVGTPLCECRGGTPPKTHSPVGPVKPEVDCPASLRPVTVLHGRTALLLVVVTRCPGSRCSRCFSGIPVWLHSRCRLSRRYPCCSGRDSLLLVCRGCYGLRAVLDASTLGPCSPPLLSLHSSSLLSSCFQSVHSVACSAGHTAGLSPFSLFSGSSGAAKSDCPTVSLLIPLFTCLRLDCPPVRTHLVLVWCDSLVFPPALRLLGCPYPRHSG